MPLLHLAILAAVQGITEFLPISSSAHLILAPSVLGWKDQGLVIDVAVHVGTLAAVLVYFARSFAEAAWGGIDLVRGRWTDGAKMALWLILGTIPVVLVGAALSFAGLTDALRDPGLIAATTILFALALWAADHWAPADHPLDAMGWRGALVVGLAQMLALLPGASRSGVTITAARALGFARDQAAKFSMLLGAPAIAGAAIVTGHDLDLTRDSALIDDALIAGALSFAFALLAIWGLMRWLKTSGFGPFVLYRLALGLVLIGLIWAGVL